MRKSAIIIGIVLAMSLILQVAAAPTAAKVSGGGWYIYSDGTRVTKSFTAEIDTEGKISGQWVVMAAPKTEAFHAVVTGLEMSGNRAIVEGMVTFVPDDSIVPPSSYVCMVVVDNGEGRGAVDQISNSLPNRTDCESATVPLSDYHGNIRISGGEN